MKEPFEMFGIECGKGWEKLYLPIKHEIERAGGTVGQIKEKFGGLRFYYTAPAKWSKEEWDEFDNKVRKAEAASYKTCEDCGETGTTRKGSWIRTLCDEHAKTKEQ